MTDTYNKLLKAMKSHRTFCLYGQEAQLPNDSKEAVNVWFKCKCCDHEYSILAPKNVVYMAWGQHIEQHEAEKAAAKQQQQEQGV